MPINAARALPPSLALAFACVPLFPAFITLTTATVPGVSLIPPHVTLALLAAMLLLVIYWAIMLLSRAGAASPILPALVAWFAAGVLAVALGFNPRDGLIFVGIFGMGVIWHSALIAFYAYPGVPRAIAWTYLISGALAAAAAIAMVLLRVPAAQFTIGHGRAIGTFVLPGELAGYLIIFLPITYAIARITHERELRILAWVSLATGAAAFVLTFSRTGWVGLASAIAFFIVVRGHRRRSALLVALLVIGVALAAVLLAFNVDHNPSENFTRISIWEAALEIINRFPLTGVGPFGFSRLYALVRLPGGDPTAFHAHSVYLTFLAEIGVIGFSAFVWTWTQFAQRLRESLRTATPQASILAIAIAAGLFGTLVQGLIDVVSIVIFGLWLPTLAYALVAAREGLGEQSA